MNIYDIWFSRIDISNNIKLKLLENFEVSKIWNFKQKELLELGLKDITINQILDKKYKEKLEKYEEYLLKNKIELLKFTDISYPQKLLNISALPAYIYVKGSKEILDDDSIAIIGSRNCTNYGKKIAYKTAKELGDKNINVVSGLAIRNRHICAQRQFNEFIW
jgi:DNA processing protein